MARCLAGGMIELVSPNTEQVIGSVAEAGDADMDAAVAAAREAFDHGPWGRMWPAERLPYLKAMADHLETRIAELARAWTLQMGGLASFAGPMHGGAVMGLRGIIGMAENFEYVQQRPSMAAAAGLIAYEPVGVVAAIAPWNGPFGIMLNKVAYALAGGCTVIMKPSPETPLETYIIAEAAEAAGLPAGRGQSGLRPPRGERPSGVQSAASIKSASPDRRWRASASPAFAANASRAARWSWAGNPRRSCATIFRYRSCRRLAHRHAQHAERAGLRDAQPGDGAAQTP